MAQYFAFVLLSCYFVAQISAYSGGAPEAVCEDMLPKHPVDPQTSKIPYKIDVSKKSANAGEVIKVSVSGGKPFKGVLVQARQGDKIVGSFNVPDTDKYIKTINCGKDGKNNAVTHKNSESKKSITVDYVAPQTKGDIEFYATVAENGGVFWVKKPLAKLAIN